MKNTSKILAIQFLTILFMLNLASCAYNPVKTMIKQRMYADAYHFSAYSGSSGIRKSTADEIKDVLKEQTGQIFIKQLEDRFDTKIRPNIYYIDNHQLVNWAHHDGLINREQQLELIRGLMVNLVADGAKDPTLLKDKKIAALYNENRNSRYEHFKTFFDKGMHSKTLTLNNLVGFYDSFAEKNDLKRLQILRDEARQQSLNLIEEFTAKDSISVVEINPVLVYLDKAKDDQLISALNPVIKKISLSPEDLMGDDSLIRRIDPSTADAEIAKRTIAIDARIDGDQFLAGEMLQELQEKDKWLKIDSKSNKKLQIHIRLQERTTIPINRTQTVANPSFATLLFIPKNASVLFDYISNENSVQWSLSVLTEQKIAKLYSGAYSNKSTECSNFRFQNVFGGTGALTLPPNEEVRSFCSSGRGTIEDLRKQAVKQMADLIYSNHVIGGQ